MTDVHKEGCKLSWSKPEDDGGLPIKEYEIEKLDTQTGKWVRVGKVNGERQPPTYNVTGLEPGKTYQFRVTAINDEGDSEPLTTAHSIVAKDPYGELLLIKFNSNGNVSSKLFLFFFAEQSTAPGQPEITDYDNKSVDLKWAAPKSDGGAPIEKYIIEKKDK